MKFRFLMGAGLAAALGAAVSAALAQQVTLISANGSLSCATHNGVQVSNNGAITIDVGSCDLGSGTGGEGGDPGGELPGSLIPSVSQISTQAGAQSTFYVRLNRAPAENVQLNLVSNNPDVVTLTGSVSFTPANYGNQPVYVTGGNAGQTSINATAQGDAAFDGKSFIIPVTVASASGGGDTGPDDPGLGKKWMTSYQGQNVFVVDRSAYSNRTYFPGCLSQSWSALGLSHNRTLNPLAVANVLNSCRSVGSLRAGEIYSQRVPFKSGKGSFSIKLARAEAGEVGGQLYDIAISSKPGDLDPTEFPNNRCEKKGTTDGSISLMARSEWNKLSTVMRGVYCPLQENTVYYFNFRPSPGSKGAADCGKSSYVCRVQILDDIQATYYQDVRVASDSY